MTDDEHPEADSDSGKTNPAADEPEEPEADGAADLSDRVLCPDGACIGIIGPNGRCKVCGTPFDPSVSGGDRADDEANDEANDEPDDEPDVEDDEGDAPDDDEGGEDTPDDDEGGDDPTTPDVEDDGPEDNGPEDNGPEDDGPEDDDKDVEDAPDLMARVLCSDGACIGVVGPDGRCKECGKPYTGEEEPADDDRPDEDPADD